MNTRKSARFSIAIGIAALGACAALLAGPADDPLSNLKAQSEVGQQAETQPYIDPLAGRHRSDEETRAFRSSLEASAARLTDEEVRKAIRNGCDFLLPRLRAMAETSLPPAAGMTPPPLSGAPRGGMADAGNYDLAYMSAGLAALLEAHRTLREPRYSATAQEMEPIVDWVCRGSTSHTYTAGLQAVALGLLPNQKEFRAPLRRLADDLISGVRRDGAYGYYLTNLDANWWDNSNSQYGLLGVWAAADAGIEIRDNYWHLVESHWRMTQDRSGHWGYKSGGYGIQKAPGFQGRDDSSLNLTVAGLASLFVVTDNLDADAKIDNAIDQAIDAVTADFRLRGGEMADNLYYAYGVQRVGVASGLKYFGTINWFRQGAAGFLINQGPDGTWQYNQDPVLGTAWAVLFLCHGGAPVAFNKLQYGFTGDWQSYRRDDAHLTRWLSKTTERPLNWQIIPREAPVEEWMDAPILLITGKGADKFSPDDIDKLKKFTEMGGIIFSVAVDDDPAFTRYVRDVAGKICGGKYELRNLPGDHPVYTLEAAVKSPFGIMGLSNGVREVWIHSPVDLAKSWTTYGVAKRDHFNVAQNLYGYAMGMTRGVRRLDTLVIPEKDDRTIRERITLGRLIYNGNADPEPGAWDRFSRALFNDTGTKLQLQNIDSAKLDAKTTKILHMTGTVKFTLAESDIRHLQKFIDDGGVIIADAAGGVGGGGDGFADSFTALANRLLPGGDPLPANHLLFKGVLRGSFPLDAPEYRKFTPAKVRLKDRPEIRSWKQGNRDAILFSPMDITGSLLGTDVWGIAGYTPDYARKLARDMLLYAQEEVPQ